MMKNTVSANHTFSVKLMTVTIVGFFLTIVNAQLVVGDKESSKSRELLFRRRVKRAIDALNKNSYSPFSIQSKYVNECTKDFISSEQTSDALLAAIYPADQLDACLNNSVLKANLTELGHIAFSKDQLLILKRKLGEIYTSGLGEEQIQQLGFIITVYGPEEISKWNITTVETLALVIKNSPNLNTTNTIIKNYLGGSGSLNAAVLDVIGGTALCTLSEEQLRTISPSELKKAKPLDISTCTQAKKDIIFGIAKEAFQDQAGDISAYYQLIKPYVSGAQASDLRHLATGNINMDFQTFSGLNPVEVKKLTAQNLPDLLGTNLKSLKENENHELVLLWVNSHSAKDVMSLGIGLRGGISPAGLGNFSFDEPPGNGSASVNSYRLLLSICLAVMGTTLQCL